MTDLDKESADIQERLAFLESTKSYQSLDERTDIDISIRLLNNRLKEIQDEQS